MKKLGGTRAKFAFLISLSRIPTVIRPEQLRTNALRVMQKRTANLRRLSEERVETETRMRAGQCPEFRERGGVRRKDQTDHPKQLCSNPRKG